MDATPDGDDAVDGLSIGSAFTYTVPVEGATFPADGTGADLAGWVGAQVPAAVAAALSGRAIAYRAQSLSFLDPPRPGDAVSFTLVVTSRRRDTGLVVLDCTATDRHGRRVATGTVEVAVGRDGELVGGAGPGADLVFHDHERYEQLVGLCRDQEPVRTAVVHPVDEPALLAAVQAAGAGIIDPVLVGRRSVIEGAAAAAGIDVSGFAIEEAPDARSAATRGVALVHEGRAAVLMKGSLHTDELLRAVTDRRSGLRTNRRISHVFVFDVPTYPKPLMVTDAVVNIAPDLEQKADICRNAIDLAHALGVAEPRVAILSAIETVNPSIRSTIDAASLCKMADRGQITGALLDGPLGMDNAISRAAATTKHIDSRVAGDADVLVVPDLEAGNILYKNLTYLAGADAAGVVLGATAPVILASRADTVRIRIASAALAAVHWRWQRTGLPGT